MDHSVVEQMKGMSREDRKAFFSSNKSALSSSALSCVNGGEGSEKQNPNSEECPYQGNWISSDGYICDGEVIC